MSYCVALAGLKLLILFASISWILRVQCMLPYPTEKREKLVFHCGLHSALKCSLSGEVWGKFWPINTGHRYLLLCFLVYTISDKYVGQDCGLCRELQAKFGSRTHFKGHPLCHLPIRYKQSCTGWPGVGSPSPALNVFLPGSFSLAPSLWCIAKGSRLWQAYTENH